MPRRRSDPGQTALMPRRRKAAAPVAAADAPPWSPTLGWLGLPLATATGVIFALYRAVRLLSYREWGDESETIVAAKMLAHGHRLYDEVFNHHGPLVFLPGFLLEQLGSFSVAGHRVPVVVLQGLAGLAIFSSPLLRGSPARHLFALFFALVTTVMLPEILGHDGCYQTYAGLFALIVLAQYTLPVIFGLPGLGPRRALLHQTLIWCLPFFSFTYLPASALLALASLRREHLRNALGGLLLASGLNLSFLLGVGSLRGYAALHLYLNTKILPAFMERGTVADLLENVVNFYTQGFLGAVLLLSLLLFITKAVQRQGLQAAWRAPAVAAAVSSFLTRPEAFHTVPFYYAMIALALAHHDDRGAARSGWVTAAWTAAAWVLVAKLALVLGPDGRLLDQRRIPATTEFAGLAQALTNPDDRIIVYSFRNYEYLAAARLPASGSFFFLPWQATYNARPRFGIRVDPCADLQRSRPKLMLLDKWLVWNRFAWDSYGGCIDALAAQHYVQIPGTPYYVRRDLWPRFLALRLPGRY